MDKFEAVSQIMAERHSPARVFFRDDDGGWADNRLQALATDFIERQLPLDIAVIPDALSDASIGIIGDLLRASDRVCIHQHGFTHANHQSSGRSCEFGTERDYQQQRLDIATGQQKLSDIFGSQVLPIFTPPWNRCTSDTSAALKSLGFRYLSRIINSEPVGHSVSELPVTIDWLKKRKGIKLGTPELVAYICGLLESGDDTIGVMLHHEHMDTNNRSLLFEFIETLRDSGRVTFHSMLDVATDTEQCLS